MRTQRKRIAPSGDVPQEQHYLHFKRYMTSLATQGCNEPSPNANGERWLARKTANRSLWPEFAEPVGEGRVCKAGCRASVFPQVVWKAMETVEEF